MSDWRQTNPGVWERGSYKILRVGKTLFYCSSSDLPGWHARARSLQVAKDECAGNDLAESIKDTRFA